jgi:DNA-binding NarL/FixJ family response regulator
MEAIRVLIVDDHPMVRRGLKSLLSLYPDILVIGEAEDSVSALDTAQLLLPDIVLLDIQLPSESGLRVADRLREVTPEVKVIALTAHDNQEYVLEALRAGARAYLLKSASDQSLVETIRLVHQGRRLLSPSLMDGLLEHLGASEETASDVPRLSEPEMRVLALMARGATNEEIATETHWSERTIKRRVARIVEALGAKNRTQAVAEAARLGLV